MKKLLIVVPSLRLGGQERVAVTAASIMSDTYEVSMAVFTKDGAVFSPDCDLYDLQVPATASKIGKAINVFKRVVKLRKLKRELKVDYTVSFGTSADFANVFSSGSGKSFIGVRGFQCIGESRLYRYVYRKCDGIICCSEAIAARIKQIVPTLVQKVHALANPYDVEQMQASAADEVSDVDFSHPTVISHGRLDRVKNYPRLIKAFSLVRSKIDGLQLVIIGEGVMREELQSLIERLGLADSVHLIGFRKNPFPYLSRSSLYVLSSYFEGFPNALIEGMTFLPAVSVDCPSGPREIMYAGFDASSAQTIECADFGLLVPAAKKNDADHRVDADDECLADAMLELLTDPVSYAHYKEKAHERAKMYSFEAYRSRLISILEATS